MRPGVQIPPQKVFGCNYRVGKKVYLSAFPSNISSASLSLSKHILGAETKKYDLDFKNPSSV